MIRPLNINAEAHTADFSCDEHGGVATGVNLNTQCPYTIDNSAIGVSGSLLTPACECVSFHPTVGGSQLAQSLAEAKTA